MIDEAWRLDRIALDVAKRREHHRMTRQIDAMRAAETVVDMRRRRRWIVWKGCVRAGHRGTSRTRARRIGDGDRVIFPLQRAQSWRGDVDRCPNQQQHRTPAKKASARSARHARPV